MKKWIKKNIKIQYFIVLSLLVHSVLLSFNSKKVFDFNILSESESRKPLKILSIKQVGENTGKKIKSIYLKEKKKKIGQKLKTKNLAPSFEGLKIPKRIAKKQTKPIKSLNRKKAIKSLSLNRESIRSFLKNSNNAQSSKQYMQALGDTDSVVKLEVPEGVKESELNKHELVFYSFQKRTAMTYINSFYKKLNEFKLQNPHLNFPMTEDQKKMVGRVVYDKSGNIVRINMMKWTHIEKLQDFFLDVLQEMSALPNPPKAILKDGEFTVFFALTVNG